VVCKKYNTAGLALHDTNTAKKQVPLRDSFRNMRANAQQKIFKKWQKTHLILSLMDSSTAQRNDNQPQAETENPPRSKHKVL
jgi:hypothetical protein